MDPTGCVNIAMGLGIRYSPIATRAVITLSQQSGLYESELCFSLFAQLHILKSKSDSVVYSTMMSEEERKQEEAAWLDDNDNTMADSLGDNEGASGPYSDTDNLDPKEIPSIISASNNFTTIRISPPNALAELS